MTCIEKYNQTVTAAAVLRDNTIALCGDTPCVTAAINQYTQAVQAAEAAYIACINSGGGGGGT